MGWRRRRPSFQFLTHPPSLPPSRNHTQITLLGQNIDAWGRDLTPKQKFSDLLHAVGKVEGIERVRFVTRCGAAPNEVRSERAYGITSLSDRSILPPVARHTATRGTCP